MAIRILPEVLSNKIAAGEVVERPASVVKELLENALDAQATKVIIEVERGGRSLIRVSDNGIGMSHDDALLCIERYATSKIETDTDLFNIQTLGFRGEAIPSIASVSRFSIETRDASSEIGTRVEVEGGRLKNVTQVGVPVGTQVTVRNLFYNTPARRKFLKTIQTEMGHITDIVASMALGHPDIRFRLIHNGKTIKDWLATSDPIHRAADVVGADLIDDLFPIELTSPGDSIQISGWMGSPQLTRNSSRSIFVYVNGRYVTDRVVRHAIIQGYGSRLMKGRFPVAILFIQVPPDQVDVNVHPRKSEVRFVAQQRVHEKVSGTIERVLNGNTPRIVRDSVSATPESVFESRMAFHPKPPAFEPSPIPESPISEPMDNISVPEPDADKPEFAMSSLEAIDRSKTKQHWDFHHLEPSTDSNSTPNLVSRTDADKLRVPKQGTIWETGFFSGLRVIGQFRNTYVLCEAKDALILIDQHAAHERVLYEQLKQRHQANKPAIQQLLIPETMELSYRESMVLDPMIPELHRLGIEIEPFGGNTYVVKAVPAALDGRSVRPLIIEMVETSAEVGFASGTEDAVDNLLKLMACHGAIRANQRLSETQMQELLRQLDQCQVPSHCPHGRPTWINWSKRFLEKAFRRVV